MFGVALFLSVDSTHAELRRRTEQADEEQQSQETLHFGTARVLSQTASPLTIGPRMAAHL